jgi:hypothetical protein
MGGRCAIKQRLDKGDTAVEADGKIQQRLAALHEEMDELHAANSLYWQKGKDATRVERAEQEFRQERLEKIRTEIAELEHPPGNPKS